MVAGVYGNKIICSDVRGLGITPVYSCSVQGMVVGGVYGC